MRNQSRLLAVLKDGERLCGEWLMQAHGTRYELKHEPFVAFDLMRGAERAIYEELLTRVAAADFVTPHLVHRGGPLGVEEVMRRLGTYGFHGALDPAEGAVWRVERNDLIRPNAGERRLRVDFLRIVGRILKKSLAPEDALGVPGREWVPAHPDGAPDVGATGRDSTASSPLRPREGLGDLRRDGESASPALRSVLPLLSREYHSSRGRLLPAAAASPSPRTNRPDLGRRINSARSRRARGSPPQSLPPSTARLVHTPTRA